MTHWTPCKQKYSALLHTLEPWMGSKGHNIFFWWSCCISNYNERGLEHYASKMFDLMLTPDVLGWVKRSDIEIMQIFWLNLVTLLIIWVIPKMALGVGEMGFMGFFQDPWALLFCCCCLLFSKKNLSGTLSEFKIVWIQIRTDILSALIWVQIVLQRLSSPLAWKELMCAYKNPFL